MNVKKLQAGRIDAFITDELVGKYLIKIGYPGQEGDFDTVARPDSNAALHVMVAKKSPGSANLIQSINEGLKKIKASGEYDKIVAKYKYGLSRAAQSGPAFWEPPLCGAHSGP